MMQYNRARRAEWAEAQKRLETDELATARLAYLKGQATPEQTVLVEAANREAEEKGIRLPPLLAPPEHRTHFEEHLKPTLQGAAEQRKENTEGKGVFGVVAGLFGGGSSTAEAAASAKDAAADNASAGAAAVEASAKGIWEREMDNQRNGGSLDRLGLAGASGSAPAGKKGWWPW